MEKRLKICKRFNLIGQILAIRTDKMQRLKVKVVSMIVILEKENKHNSFRVT